MKNKPQNTPDLDDLFAEARAGTAPGEHPREYGFEDRLMRRIAAEKQSERESTMPGRFWQRFAPVSPIITGLLTLAAITWSAGQVRELQDLLLFTQDALSLSGILLGV